MRRVNERKCRIERHPRSRLERRVRFKSPEAGLGNVGHTAEKVERRYVEVNVATLHVMVEVIETLDGVPPLDRTREHELLLHTEVEAVNRFGSKRIAAAGAETAAFIAAPIA